MIGWFSLNVPSGLTLYWFTNNLLTTAQQVISFLFLFRDL
jgi:YidC/Oxa1 family membrane protein insertase